MFARFRFFAAYLFAIPLALILGVLASSPDALSITLVTILVFCLLFPILLRWHTLFLVLLWNSAFGLFFLPGQPMLWLLVAGMSFGLCALEYIFGRRPFIPVREMTLPLLCLAMVVIFTAAYRGGIGLKALGGESNGGKYYLILLGSIMGYFALTAFSINPEKGKMMAGLYFVSSATYGLSNLAYIMGPAAYFIYYVISFNAAYSQAANDVGLNTVERIQGLGQACIGFFCFFLSMNGLRESFKFLKPWRAVFLIGVVVASAFAGFRSMFLLICLVLMFQVYFERLYRSRVFILSCVGAGVVFVFMLAYADKLPLTVQRTLSFLPLKLDSAAVADAASSTEWRMKMWSVVWSELPKYLVVGKGYSIDATAMYLTKEAIRDGLIPDYEESLLAGDYHSGPLSILVPFGIIGTLAFLWVLIAGFRVLLCNYRYGPPALARTNTAFLSVYSANVVSYFFIFGSFYTQLSLFLGLVGMSVALNRGVNRNPSLIGLRQKVFGGNRFAIERDLA